MTARTLSPWIARLAARAYAGILRAYPRTFRERCAAPMLETFEAVCAEHVRRGALLPLFRECTGECLNAAAGAWRVRRPRRAGPRVAAAPRASWVSSLLQDVRYAIRRLVTQPSLVFFTVVTLGFAIAATTSLFSIVDAVMLRPSPFGDSDRLMNVNNRTSRGITFPGLSARKVKHWRTERDIFESVETYRPISAVLTGGLEPEQVPAAQLSPGLLATLAVAPAAGRLFTPVEGRAGDDRVVLISERLWRGRFGSDASAIGRPVTINGRPHTIVGVMPRRFNFPTLREQLWTPLDPEAPRAEGERVANTLARVKPELTAAMARQRIDAAVARLNVEQPVAGGWGIVLSPGTFTGADERTRRAVLVLFGAVGLVLLTACANVANLLLSRAVDRHREFAIRLVLGAGRARLARELLIEGLVLGLAAGAVGLAAARWAIATLVRLAPESLLYSTTMSIDIDGRVMVFGIAIAVATGMLCNLPPALRSFRLSPGNEALSGRTRTATETPVQRRLRAALVMLEVALAVVLLVGAALMARSFVRLNAVDIGFDSEHVLAVTVGLDSDRYRTEASRAALLKRVAADVETLPGVRGVAVASGLPPSAGSMSLAWLESATGRCGSDEPEMIVSNLVTPNYFTLLRIPVTDGRGLRRDDPPEAVVVSRAVAQRCGTTAGGRLRLGPEATWLTVVGVAGDVKTRGLTAEGGDLAIYMSFDAGPGALPNVAEMIERRLVSRRLVIQTDRPMAIVPDVKRLLWAADPDQPVLSAAPAEELMADTVRQERFVLTLMSLFSCVALALASAGIFGVLAYAVAQRTNEIGIRMALGASSRDVLRMVVGQGMTVAAAGVFVGILAALAFSKALSGLLYEIEPRDPVAFVAMPALVFIVALAASWIPTLRALRVDPASALRVE